MPLSTCMVVPEEDRARPVLGTISHHVYQKLFNVLGESIANASDIRGSDRVARNGRGAIRGYVANDRSHPSCNIRSTHRLRRAAGDLMEQCGLNQMYSMCFGTVPIVRATGGLDDATSGRGTGFRCLALESSALLPTAYEVLSVFQVKTRCEFSSGVGCQKYLPGPSQSPSASRPIGLWLHREGVETHGMIEVEEAGA